tara:strand:+ start:174 stop:845 length:672 start_codon:yes stop_codon:yes gene_type:complete
MEQKQTGLQFNRSEFFVTERGGTMLDIEKIETKLDQLNDLMDDIATREKQLINMKSRLSNEEPKMFDEPFGVVQDLPLVSVDEPVKEVAIERNENGRKVRKDKGKKRGKYFHKVKGFYRANPKTGEEEWIAPHRRKATKKKDEQVLEPIVEQPTLPLPEENPKDVIEYHDGETVEIVEEVEVAEPVKKKHKKRGHYRTLNNGTRCYVGKKPLSLKLKELVGLA